MVNNTLISSKENKKSQSFSNIVFPPDAKMFKNDIFNGINIDKRNEDEEYSPYYKRYNIPSFCFKSFSDPQMEFQKSWRVLPNMKSIISPISETNVSDESKKSSKVIIDIPTSSEHIELTPEIKSDSQNQNHCIRSANNRGDYFCEESIKPYNTNSNAAQQSIIQNYQSAGDSHTIQNVPVHSNFSVVTNPAINAQNVPVNADSLSNITLSAFANSNENIQNFPIVTNSTSNVQRQSFPIGTNPIDNIQSFPVVTNPTGYVQNFPVVTNPTVNAQSFPVVTNPTGNVQNFPVATNPIVNAQSFPVVTNPTVNAQSFPVVTNPTVNAQSFSVVTNPSVNAQSFPVVTNPTVNAQSFPVTINPSVNAQSFPVVTNPTVNAQSFPVTTNPYGNIQAFPVFTNTSGNLQNFPVITNFNGNMQTNSSVNKTENDKHIHSEFLPFQQPVFNNLETKYSYDTNVPPNIYENEANPLLLHNPSAQTLKNSVQKKEQGTSPFVIKHPRQNKLHGQMKSLLTNDDTHPFLDNAKDDLSSFASLQVNDRSEYITTDSRITHSERKPNWNIKKSLCTHKHGITNNCQEKNKTDFQIPKYFRHNHSDQYKCAECNCVKGENNFKKFPKVKNICICNAEKQCLCLPCVYDGNICKKGNHKPAVVFVDNESNEFVLGCKFWEQLDKHIRSSAIKNHMQYPTDKFDGKDTKHVNMSSNISNFHKNIESGHNFDRNIMNDRLIFKSNENINQYNKKLNSVNKTSSPKSIQSNLRSYDSYRSHFSRNYQPQHKNRNPYYETNSHYSDHDDQQSKHFIDHNDRCYKIYKDRDDQYNQNSRNHDHKYRRNSGDHDAQHHNDCRNYVEQCYRNSEDINNQNHRDCGDYDTQYYRDSRNQGIRYKKDYEDHELFENINRGKYHSKINANYIDDPHDCNETINSEFHSAHTNLKQNIKPTDQKQRIEINIKDIDDERMNIEELLWYYFQLRGQYTQEEKEKIKQFLQDKAKFHSHSVETFEHQNPVNKSKYAHNSSNAFYKTYDSKCDRANHHTIPKGFDEYHNKMSDNNRNPYTPTFRTEHQCHKSTNYSPVRQCQMASDVINSKHTPMEYDDIYSNNYSTNIGYQNLNPEYGDQNRNSYCPDHDTDSITMTSSIPKPPPLPLYNSENTVKPSIEKVLRCQPLRPDEYGDVLKELKQVMNERSLKERAEKSTHLLN